MKHISHPRRRDGARIGSGPKKTIRVLRLAESDALAVEGWDEGIL